MQNDELYRLVHSLSSPEKRFFKMQSRGRSGPEEKSYLRLFDLLNSQKEYNLEKIRIAFANEGYAKYLSWAQNNLFKLILESQRKYLEGKEVRFQLDLLLQDIRFLISRQLFKKSRKLIKKGLLLAQKYDFQTTLIELLEISRIRVREQQEAGYEQEARRLTHAKNKAITALQLTSKLRDVYEELVLISREAAKGVGGSVREEIESVLKQPWLQNKPETGSFYAIHFFYLIHATYALFSGNYSGAHAHFSSLYQHWEAHPDIVVADYGLYQRVLNNYLSGCQAIGDFSSFQAVLPKLDAAKALSPNDVAETFQNYHHQALIYYLNTDQLAQATQLVPAIEKGLKKYSNKINLARKITFYHHLSLLYFLTEQYGEAWAWNEKILALGNTVTRKDLRQFAEILRILLAYERGEYDYLENLIRSSTEYFRRKKMSFSFEEGVIGCMRKLIRAMDDAERQKQMRLFYQMLKSDEGREFAEAGTSGFEEVCLWLESHIEGIPIAEALRRRG